MSAPTPPVPDDPPRDADLARAQQPPSGITWRSLLLGSLAILFICGLTPFNDLALSDTNLTNGFLPIGLVLVEFALIVLVNAPLRRIAPARALRREELQIVLLMSLLACALPAWGLMRFLVPTPVAYFYIGTSEAQFWRMFSQMGLPQWLFPVDIASGRGSPVVQWFYTSLPAGESLPWAAWAKPAVAWGIFAVAMIATLVAMARLVTLQWTTNERLPFPLVQVHAELIEPPERGRMLNSVLRNRLLWIGLIAVFVIQMMTSLSGYYPRYIPRIPLAYDFTGIWGDQPRSGEPLSYLDTKIKKATLSFIVLGVTYFIRTRVAFSLWCIFVLTSLVNVGQGLRGGGEITSQSWGDQHLGACVAFVGATIWIARQHWLRVLRNAVGAGDGSQYRASFWIAVLGTATMVGWLWVVGVQWWMAGLIVLFILLAHFIVARVVAETGLPFYRSAILSSQVFSNLPASMVTPKSVFFAGVFTVLGPLTTRDSVTTYATHGFALTDPPAGAPSSRARNLRLGATVVWALALAFVVAGVSTLWCQYNYPTPMTRDATFEGNNTGAWYMPKRDAVDPLVRFGDGQFAPKQHNSLVQMGIGFVVMLGLELASMRWAGWPLLPVGYVASYGSFIGNAWFSIFVGWAIKALIVRFGGSSLFNAARPLFIGMIFGEALAAGATLIINAVVVLNGGANSEVRFLP